MNKSTKVDLYVFGRIEVKATQRQERHFKTKKRNNVKIAYWINRVFSGTLYLVQCHVST
jgi:hypothetical protein